VFEDSSSCERPNGGPLSLDRDLRGGIGEGLGEHAAVMRGGVEVKVENASGVIERAASCSGVLRGAFTRRMEATGICYRERP
jgi:hypothetical protein